MNKKVLIGLSIAAIIAGGFMTARALTCTTVFPNALDNYTSSSCIASSWANALEAKIGINGSTATSSLTYQAASTTQKFAGTTINGVVAPWTLATSVNSGISITASGSVFTWGQATSTGSQNGYLSSSDWTKFSNKASSTVQVVAGTGLNGGGDLSGPNRTLNLTVPVNVANGGTGTTTYVGGLIYASGTNAFYTIATSSLGIGGGSNSNIITQTSNWTQYNLVGSATTTVSTLTNLAALGVNTMSKITAFFSVPNDSYNVSISVNGTSICKTFVVTNGDNTILTSLQATITNLNSTTSEAVDCKWVSGDASTNQNASSTIQNFSLPLGSTWNASSSIFDVSGSTHLASSTMNIVLFN